MTEKEREGIRRLERERLKRFWEGMTPEEAKAKRKEYRERYLLKKLRKEEMLNDGGNNDNASEPHS